MYDKYEPVGTAWRVYSGTCTCDCSLLFGYNIPASRILHLQGSLFLPLKEPEVWTVIHWETGYLDPFSVDNSKGKLTQLCKGVFYAEADTLLTYILFPGKLWRPALKLLFLGTGAEPERLSLEAVAFINGFLDSLFGHGAYVEHE